MDFGDLNHGINVSACSPKGHNLWGISSDFITQFVVLISFII
jgi:hypothetical protein